MLLFASNNNLCSPLESSYYPCLLVLLVRESLNCYGVLSLVCCTCMCVYVCLCAHKFYVLATFCLVWLHQGSDSNLCGVCRFSLCLRGLSCDAPAWMTFRDHKSDFFCFRMMFVLINQPLLIIWPHLTFSFLKSKIGLYPSCLLVSLILNIRNGSFEFLTQHLSGGSHGDQLFMRWCMIHVSFYLNSQTLYPILCWRKIHTLEDQH